MGTQGSRASALAVRRTNLPSESSSFVGRQKSLLALEEQVEPGFVVSIIGTGGTGKSRLAVHYGVRELGRWLAFGGVWFCPLVEARSVEDMVAQVARVLDVSLEGLDSDLEDAAVLRIGWALAGRGQVLLILDNFEQLDASASKVLGLWLDLASELSLIVTSREALRIPRERLLRLEPLDEEDAVQLFEDRGRSVRPDLALNEAELSVVRQIVARVDRIPLAVELAAARVAILPPQKILERLSQRFRLLRGRAEGRGTLEGTIAWSWDLLKPYEQEAMWQCTAFRGGFRLEAAEEVLDLSRHEGDPWVLDVLEALREKSLLTFGRQIDRTDEARFVILESIREYAASKAPPGGSWEAVLARHAQSTLAHAEEKAQLWEGRGDVGALAELSLEQENLLAVHERGLTAGSAEAARAATALVPVLRHTRPLQEFSSFLEAVEVASRGTEPAVRARLLFVAASTTLTTRTIEANLDLLGEAVREALSAGDRRTACQALCFGSQQLLLWGRTAEAGDHYERAHELSEALNDPTLQPYVTRTEAMLASETDTDASAQLHRAALRQWEALGHRPGACREQNYLAILAVEREDYAEAERLFRKALRGLQKMGSRRTAQMLSANLGLVQAQLGQFDDSRKTLRTTIEEARALGSRLVETLSLNSLLELEIVTGRVERAGELADRVARMLDATFPPNIQVVLRIGQASAFRACGRLSEALSEAEEAVRQAEDEPDQRSLPRARAVLAMCLSKIGKFEEARVQMRTARSDQKSDELSQAERYFYEAAELSLDLLGAEQDPEDCAGKVAAVLASSAEQVVAWEKHVEGVCDLGIRTQLALASSEVRRLGGEASA